MIYLLTESDLGKQVSVHVPDLRNPDQYIEKSGYLASFDDNYVYIKYPDAKLAMAEMPDWCFWKNGS